MSRAATIATIVQLALTSCAPPPVGPTPAMDAGADAGADAPPDAGSPVLPAQTWELTATVEELSLDRRHLVARVHPRLVQVVVV